MKKLLAIAILTMIGCMPTLQSFGAAVDLDAAPGKLGWHLGAQAYTFRAGTLVEALAKGQKLGLKFMEFYPKQKFSAEQPFSVDQNMTPEQREMVKKAAADAGIKLMSFGVSRGKNAEDWEKIFSTAHDMGLEFVDIEPKEDEVPMVDAIAKKYKVRVAIHNHPQPSFYWNPETVLAAVAKGSDLWGGCADTGHWVRSGLDPLECLRKMKGHIGFFHFKDLNVRGPKANDVPWGTGVNNVYAALAEMKDQGFKGYFAAEYEHDTPQLMDEVAQSFDYFRILSAALDDGGWTPLLKDDLSNAVTEPDGWSYEKGVLTAKGKGDLWTKERYGDYILDLEFQCAAETNSGVFVRCGDLKDWLNTAIEVQIYQGKYDNPRWNCGSIFDVKAPEEDRTKPAGEWNHFTIVARKNMLYVILNGAQVLNINLDEWTKPGLNPDGSKNKFKNAYKDMPREGFVGLQYHGQPIAFRNVRIKTLN